MEKLRTFIAIKLTPEIISNISRVQEELKKSDTKVKWVNPENIHLTLNFLGHITPEELERVRLAIREVLKPFAAFRMDVFGLGAFPKIKHPRVIWVGVKKGREVLKEIASNFEERLARMGFAREKREFSPHLTLGRVKFLKKKESLIEILTTTPAANLGEMEVEKISIMRSQLAPHGPIYTTLEEIPLKEQGIAGITNKSKIKD